MTTDQADFPFPKRPSRAKCSYCGSPFDPRSAEHMPFCSRRCRQIDLGMWYHEEYGLPLETAEEENGGIDDED